jgi:DsbC/DsbD-like thiol-disulfide interchange protein
VLLAALLAFPAAAQPRANHLAVELVAKGPAAPGGTAELAIVMTPEKGWHGYWSNPGDAGYGMELDWSLPQGWKAGEPEYPVPHTLLQAGPNGTMYTRGLMRCWCRSRCLPMPPKGLRCR